MSTELIALAKDFWAERNYEMALQVLTKAYAEGDFEARALMGDIYADERYEGRDIYRALSCYIEAQRCGVDMEDKILELLNRDWRFEGELDKDHLLERLWGLFSKEPERYMELISLIVTSQIKGYERYVKKLIKACERYLKDHPGDVLSSQCLARLYDLFGTEKDRPRMVSLERFLLDQDPNPDSIDYFLRYVVQYDPSGEPDAGLWHYVDQLQESKPEAYWYYSGVQYFYADRFAEAFQSFEVGTTRFGGRSQVALGYCYMYGIGTPKDIQKGVELLTPLRYQYPIANMYLAHERMFREVSNEGFLEAWEMNQLLKNEYLLEGLLDCLWLSVAFCSRFPVGERVGEIVKPLLDMVLKEEHKDAFTVRGLLGLLKVFPACTQKEAEESLLQGVSQGSSFAGLVLATSTTISQSFMIDGFLAVALNKEVDPHFRAVCYLNCFLHSSILRRYNAKQQEHYLAQMVLLKPAYAPYVKGLRLVGYYLGKVYKPVTMRRRLKAYQAQYPECRLVPIVDALIQGRFKEALPDWVRNPEMKEDLVAAQVLIILCVGLNEDEDTVELIRGWIANLAPFTDFYRVAEACSGRLFPSSLMAME